MKVISFVILLSLQLACNSQGVKKINGVSFVASNEKIKEKHVDPVVNLQANYAAIMPFGFIKSLVHPEIIFNTERQWYGETRNGAKQYIQELQKKKIRIMVKPQIWVSHGEFTGFIEMKTEENWRVLEKSYTSFILEYAELAQETNAEIFCIGTELEKFIDKRPSFWTNLIVEIKKVYKGKLTYAANWDEFKRTPFWDDMDYIGLDAYFPVSDSKTPTVLECLDGWKKHEFIIKGLSEKYKKPILFTEFGYRSVDYTGKEPWKSERRMNQINLLAQTNATKALFDTFWKEDWFAGGFIWKWFHDHENAGGENNYMFTPQNKPVESLIKKQYAFYK